MITIYRKNLMFDEKKNLKKNCFYLMIVDVTLVTTVTFYLTFNSLY